MNYYVILIAILIGLASCNSGNTENTSIITIDETGKPVIQANIDTVSYDIVSMEKTVGECDADGCATVIISYPEWETMPKGMNDAALKKWCDQSLLSYWGSETPLNSTDELIDQFFAGYVEVKKEIGTAADWSLERSINVIYNSTQWISLQYKDYSYAGGAHPNSVTGHASFNAHTGKQLVFTDLMGDSNIERLTALGEKAFRKEREIAEGTSLEDAGFMFEDGKFYLPEYNMAVVKNGLQFYYNAYEVGPYALGPTAIFLSWAQLEDLLKESTLI